MDKPLRSFNSRANPDKMFVIPEYSRKDGLMTEYLAYECYRTRTNERYDLYGGVTEHLRIIDWYLSTYLQHRKLKLPISSEQASFLNTPVPILDLAHEISTISFSFIRRELGQNWDLNNAKIASEAVYWWCIERSPMLHLQDILVPNYYVDLLNGVNPHSRWEEFHTNYFVIRYHEVHPNLHFLDLSRKSDRAALMAHFVLLCADEPHLVRFLPRESVGRLLAPLSDNSEFNVLDSIIATTIAATEYDGAEHGRDDSVLSPDIGERHAMLSKAKVIREKVVAKIDTAGYSLRLGRRVVKSSSGHSAVCYSNKMFPSLRKGVSIIGPLHAGSGLGQAARLSVEALRHTQWPLVTKNFDMDNPAPVGFSSKVGRHSNEESARQINLIHLNAESIPLAFAYLDQGLYRNSYNIGFFFWELTRIPACHHLALNMLDEIWVSSEYNKEIYSSYTDIPVINVGMAVEPVGQPANLTRQHLGISATSFVFLTTFDSFSFVERKNPLGVIRAFQKAFPSAADDVVLLIKTQNRFKVDDPYQKRLWNQISGYCSMDSRIIVLNDTLSYSELLGLKSLCNCYVSLHRSEGWGFGMIEAMQLGLPVIATGYSGNMEFCNARTCYLVEYDLIEPKVEEYIFVERGSQWADPRIESASECMKAVYSDKAKALHIATAGQDYVKTVFSVSEIAKRYDTRLKSIVEKLGKGQLPKSSYDILDKDEIIDAAASLVSAQDSGSGAKANKKSGRVKGA